MDKSQSIKDVDIIAQLKFDLNQVKQAKHHPLVLVDALEVEKELQEALGAMQRFRETQMYVPLLKEAVAYVKDAVKRGNAMSSEEQAKFCEEDWVNASKRHLRMLNAELQKMQLKNLKRGKLR